LPAPWHVVHASTPNIVVLSWAWAVTYGASWQLVHTEVSGASRKVWVTFQNGEVQ
jgi:hypothetical protein